MEEWEKEGWLPGNAESPQPQRARPHLGQQLSISQVIHSLSKCCPQGYQTKKSLWKSIVCPGHPIQAGWTNKEQKASYPGREGRDRGDGRCLAVTNTNHWHDQDQFQPLDKSTRNESEQCTLMRKRKFHFIYLLFMSCSFGSTCNRNSKAILKLVGGTNP